MRPASARRRWPAVSLLSTLSALCGVLAACDDAERAGSDRDAASRESSAGTPARGLPAWMSVDAEGDVRLVLAAGRGTANGGWNFNGHFGGDVTIVVRAGTRVTLDFSNQDPANAHSVAVLEAAFPFPISFDDPRPAFPGAITAEATSITEATLAGESQTIAFDASRPGAYALVCLVPAHAATGMWIGFEVGADAAPGVRPGPP